MIFKDNQTTITGCTPCTIIKDNSDHTLYQEEIILYHNTSKFKSEKPKKIFTKPHHAKKKKNYEY